MGMNHQCPAPPPSWKNNNIRSWRYSRLRFFRACCFCIRILGVHWRPHSKPHTQKAFRLQLVCHANNQEPTSQANNPKIKQEGTLAQTLQSTQHQRGKYLSSPSWLSLQVRHLLQAPAAFILGSKGWNCNFNWWCAETKLWDWTHPHAHRTWIWYSQDGAYRGGWTACGYWWRYNYA